MKTFLVLFLALLVSVPAFAQDGGRRHRDGDRRNGSWRGGSSGGHHYLHRSHSRHHSYGGHHHRHGGFRSGWGHYGYYSRPSYIYLDRDIYGYGYTDYGYGGLSYGRPVTDPVACGGARLLEQSLDTTAVISGIAHGEVLRWVQPQGISLAQSQIIESSSGKTLQIARLWNNPFPFLSLIPCRRLHRLRLQP